MENNKYERGVEVVVGAIIENSEGKILLARSPKWNGKWIIPGGHIEPGEAIEEAGLREVKEEVGLDLKSLGIISYGEMINLKDFHRPAHFIYFDILCKIKDQEVRIDGDELTEYGWFLPEEALKIELTGGSRKGVNEYIKFISKK